MRSTAESDVDTEERFKRLLLAFGRDLDPTARPRVLAFLHLIRDAHEVTADVAIADDGSLVLVLTGEGEPGDPITPLLS